EGAIRSRIRPHRPATGGEHRALSRRARPVAAGGGRGILPYRGSAGCEALRALAPRTGGAVLFRDRQLAGPPAGPASLARVRRGRCRGRYRRTDGARLHLPGLGARRAVGADGHAPARAGRAPPWPHPHTLDARRQGRI
ncbi:MAG: hypothetical protein AVDCRST_MAG88-1337, partial [uncultured Thermomicrobiales bacterium]